MTTLYLDLGNTQAKWRYEGAQGVAQYGSIADQLQSSQVSPSKVVLSSVLAEHRYAEVLSEIRPVCKGGLKRCLVSKQALGVTCAYENPNKLGVDRWLAVLAAWHRYRKPCLVVDLGTAATIDVLDDKACHKGGYIVSGLSLALSGLLSGTQNIKPDPSHFDQADLGPGTDTAAAIYNGALLSVVSLIEASYQNLLKTHSQAKLILAGGDAAIVGSHLSSQFELIEDLVFQGMQLLDQADLVVDA